MSSLHLQPTSRCHGKPLITRTLHPISAIHLRFLTKIREKTYLKTCTSNSRISSVFSDGYESRRNYESSEEMKTALYRTLHGVNRGIFGVTSAKKNEIWELVEMLESRNPTLHPTDNLLDKVNGSWKMIYSTIVILGSKRTKLGLRDFITLGDFFQIIDVAKKKAVNSIKFNASGFKLLNGQLTIEASYTVTSKTRVDIKLEKSTITPSQLMNLFEKNYDVLLDIFNPEGWLDITYVDDSLRIGRDDKGNIFVLERSGEEI